MKVESTQSLAISAAEISNETVVKAMDALIKKITPFYFQLIKETKGLQAKNPLYNPNYLSQTFSDGKLSVYAVEGNQRIDNARYCVRIDVESKDLDKTNDLDDFLIQLREKLFDLGYTDNETGRFDILFEKGYMPPSGADFWHFDQTFKTAVTICFGNKANWSTRVFDVVKAFSCNEGFNLEDFKKSIGDTSAITITRLFKSLQINGEPSQLGCFYDALNVCHRAPIESDLEGEKLDLNDYRFFIRYREFHKS